MDGSPDAFWDAENYTFGWNRIEGRVSSTNGTDWSFGTGQNWHTGLAYYDIDSNGIFELICARAIGTFWEVRNPETGEIISTLPGLPPDIRTAPILEADKLDLYYFLGRRCISSTGPACPPASCRDEATDIGDIHPAPELPQSV
jgi:hypothetical protein